MNEEIRKFGKPMSEKYRLMVYFALATLYIYRKDIFPVNKINEKGINLFREKNRTVLKRVCDEAKNLFGYELSSGQIERAIAAYLVPGQSVSGRKVATL